MKVVINSCFGGFCLSEAAIKRLKSQDYECYPYTRENKDRCHPLVVEAVESLGSKKAGGPYSKLRVIEIPFDGPEGRKIEEYDGREKIVTDGPEWL